MVVVLTIDVSALRVGVRVGVLCSLAGVGVELFPVDRYGAANVICCFVLCAKRSG